MDPPEPPSIASLCRPCRPPSRRRQRRPRADYLPSGVARQVPGGCPTSTTSSSSGIRSAPGRGSRRGGSPRSPPQRDLRVDWRFICLRLVNAAKDYERDFPAGYIAGHGSGQKLLRVAAAMRDAEGRDPIGDLYTQFGGDIHVRGWREDIVGATRPGSPTTCARSASPTPTSAWPTTSAGTPCCRPRPTTR